MSVSRTRRPWSVALAVLAAAVGLGSPGTAAAADPTPIAAKYAAMGGPGGVLGAELGPESCGTDGGCTQLFDGGLIAWSTPTGAHAIVGDDVVAEWTYQRDVASGIGYPVTDTFCGLRDAGCGEHFQGGSIYDSAGTPALFVPTTFRDAWARTGWENGPLGYPLLGASCRPLPGGWCGQTFQHGAVVTAGGTYAVWGAAHQLWAATGWQDGELGWPTRSTFCGLRDGGCGQHFEGGSVYWSPATGTQVVAPDVLAAWGATGWENGPLGYPAAEELCGLRGDGCLQYFQRGTVYVSEAGAFAVSGSILRRWGAEGWENGPLGYPTSAPFCGLRDGGCGQYFEDGSIYSSPAGTFAVSAGNVTDSSMGSVWARQGWESGALGYPASEEFVTLHGVGQHFQGGSVYADYSTSAFATYVVPGAIRDTWGATGWERGPLGRPVSAAFCGLRDGGCGQHFAGDPNWFPGGSVYSSPAGTFVVRWQTRNAWAAQGWEGGALGYPTSSTFCGLKDGACGQHFQGGSVYSSPASRSQGVVVPPAIGRLWAAQGWEHGRLGYPTAPARVVSGRLSQSFQGGTLTAP